MISILNRILKCKFLQLNRKYWKVIFLLFCYLLHIYIHYNPKYLLNSLSYKTTNLTHTKYLSKIKLCVCKIKIFQFLRFSGPNKYCLYVAHSFYMHFIKFLIIIHNKMINFDNFKIYSLYSTNFREAYNFYRGSPPTK